MTWRGIVGAACLAAAVCLVACDDEPAAGGAGGAGGGAADFDDGVSGRPEFGMAGPEMNVRLDGGARDMARAGAGFREPCDGNLDCASGWCVPFEDRNVCSRPCLQDGCPDSWGCVAVANTVPDVVFICFPPGNRLCGLCVQDADCPNGACINVDGQQVCGLNCSDDETCPSGYACSDGQCRPTTNSCTCNEKFEGQERLCQNANEFGTCLGRETCDPANGWVGCDAQQPAAEICNALDDDCNGLPDDIVGLGEVCTRDAEVDGEVRSCAGRLICSAEAGPEPTCTAVEPSAERCNFVDDDCDGETDEGFEQQGTVCVVGEGVCQRVGVFACSLDGVDIACDVTPGEPAEELCDGLDNDCDGQTDEAFPDLNGACEAGVGACRRAGAVRCAPDGAGTLCTAEAGAPADELCDGLDNDCDGSADETWPDLFAPCDDGVGACRRQGFQLCTEDGLGTTCTAQAAEPGVEVCNGVDDDCDETIDEGYPGVNQPCSAGVGLCQTPGVTVCSPDGAQVVCSAAPGEPVDEVCNGLDDDCDGAIDEGFAELDTVCQVGDGACARVGIFRCAEDGAGVACNATPGEPGLEVCNGADDDCDGAADEDFPDKDRPCTAGEGLCGRSGVFRCTEDGAATVCDASPGEPVAEVCDGFDNDCDGTPDEGFPGVNEPCAAGEGACRRAGITVCSPDGGEVVCNAQAAEPAPEVCNGLDDDCDGTPDNGFDDLLTACSAGEGQCLRRGVRVCAADGAGTTCDAQAGQPAAERCDGLDNDCDGERDEDYAGLGTACVAGQGVCRANGVWVCSDDGGAVVCDAQPGPAGEERCDGLDNDCDGQVDEGYAGLGTACSVGRGVCQANGVRVCAADGGAVVCDAQAGDPVPERCDGLDNDCDGERDEGFVGLGTACSAGQGACQSAGVRICAADGASVVCDARAGEPVPERCNAVDDDCDGQTDEGFLGLGEACTAGQGACLRQGVRLCRPDGAGVACSAQPGAPVAEACDAIDNDCDGQTDEAFPNLNRACEAGVGACRQVGVQVCRANGRGTECDAVAGAPAGERCDAIDNDCDGEVDEAFPTLGRACEAGVGECRRGGIVACDGLDAVACDAVAGAPAAEACNYRDDDCDGTVDDGFVNGQGLYTQVAHCGACNADCNVLWDLNPAAFGVIPTCEVEGGVAQCGYQCLGGRRDADGRADNGCELVIDADAIYVATPEDGGVAAGDCGTVDRPCDSIGRGLTRAEAAGRRRVRVAEGIYRETVDLVAGVDLLGGHNRTTWVQDPELSISLIEGDTLDDPTHQYGVRAINIAQPTRLSGFIVRSQTPLAAGGNSYGIYVRDCTSALRVDGNRVLPGDGGRGVDGASGGSGLAGSPGQAGDASFSALDPAPCGANPGAIGGLRSCGGVNVNGGNGGTGTCPQFGAQSGSGQDGRGPGASSGGAGGWHLISLAPNECTVSDNGPADARGGSDGASGVDGQGGAGAAAGAGQGGAHWTGMPGQAGASGVAGTGGGGGGAAASVLAAWALDLGFFVAADIGASGGGGGSGGCPGIAGQAGTAGGGSFAIYVTFVARPVDLPVITDNALARGRGGPGGDGGQGGGGGEGGPGGTGGPPGADGDLIMGFCNLEAGPGGTGGRGGHGGGGGGGMGGASYDIFVSGAGGAAVPYQAQNQFTRGDDATGGPGGEGGNASNVAIGPGGPGADGGSGRVAAQ